jgi:hypothetical protein
MMSFELFGHFNVQEYVIDYRISNYCACDIAQARNHVREGRLTWHGV